jgi:pantetheine-phosphate adenylyltransferase
LKPLLPHEGDIVKRALTPGTFDPITSGHLDVITRAAQLVDEVVVAVAISNKKNPLFTLEERVALVKEATKDLPNVSVEPFDELLVDFAHRMEAQAVIKGLRAITDFEYEFQMTALNYQLDQELETLFIMSTPQHMYLSSSIVREIASMGGDVSRFVPPCVNEALRKKFNS